MFSDPTIRRRYNIGEVVFVGLLYIGQFSLFVFAVWFDSSDNEGKGHLSLLSVDGQALGGAQLALSILCALSMSVAAIIIALKNFRLVKGGVQLHFVMILWVVAFFAQGFITLMAQWFDQYVAVFFFWLSPRSDLMNIVLRSFRDVWYDVNGTTTVQLLGDAIYSLCEWLPTYFVLEQKFRSRIMSYTFDTSRHEEDLERVNLLDGVARKMSKSIPKSDLYIGDREKIGEGSFGVVYKGVYNGEDVAIKVIKHTEDDVAFVEEFCKEVLALAELSHPNIVRFIGACLERPDISIVTEYVSRGSLRRILDDPSIQLTPDMIQKLILGVSEGMRYLHRMGVLHRDMKSDNLLVTSDWNVKITDFGLARLMERKDQQQERMTRHVGTLGWIAPERALLWNPLLALPIYRYRNLYFSLLFAPHPFFFGLRLLTLPIVFDSQ
jgi:predicted Ser/Thr protein kinase